MTAIFTATLLLIGSVWFVRKKTFEYFFTCTYFLLPDYFCIDVGHNLPVLSAGRVLLVVFAIYTVRYFDIRATLTRIKGIPKIVLALSAGYCIFRFIPNIYHILSEGLGNAVKTILSVILEQAVLTLLLLTVFDSREKVNKAIKCIIYSSVLVYILGIFESFSGIGLGELLYTANRSMLCERYFRLGLLRASFTFGLPSFFGSYCVLILVLIHYMFVSTGEKKYLVILGLNFFANLHCNSRGQLIFWVITLILCFTFIKNKETVKISVVIKSYAALFSVCFAIILCMCISSNKMHYYYIGTAESLLNEVGFNFDLDAGAPEGEKYGENSESGSYSRFFQLSGISYVLEQNPVFGLGSGAQNLGRVRYKYKSRWSSNAQTYDVAYVAMIMDEGICGWIAYGCLFVLNLLLLIKQKNRLWLVLQLSYLMVLLTVVTMDELFWVVQGLFFSYSYYKSEDKNKYSAGVRDESKIDFSGNSDL